MQLAPEIVHAINVHSVYH